MKKEDCKKWDELNTRLIGAMWDADTFRKSVKKVDRLLDDMGDSDWEISQSEYDAVKSMRNEFRCQQGIASRTYEACKADLKEKGLW